MNNIISFDHVTKSFPIQEERTFKDVIPHLLSGKPWAKEHEVFKDVTFSIHKGETIGIIGRNGAGKSTMLKLIAGVTSPTSGSISILGKVAPLIELGAGFHHELTGYENIFLNAAILGMHRKEIESKVESIIDFSELREYIHVPVKKYSSGMYMRLGFAVAIHTDMPILLIDEVLAVGDVAFQNKCLMHLQEMKKSANKTIVFVSHDEKAVKGFCERVLLIDHQTIVFDGHAEKAFIHYNQLLKQT